MTQVGRWLGSAGLILVVAACAGPATVGVGVPPGQIPGAGPMGPNTGSPSVALVAPAPRGPRLAPRVTQPIPVPSAPSLPVPVARPAAPVAVARPAAGAPEFTFQIGDQLEVSVWSEKELTTTHTVMRDGTIPAKAVGNVRVLGRSLDAVQADLTERYSGFLIDPRVSIRVLSVWADRVFVLGEVGKPAAVTLQGRTTVMQAIAQAGGFNNGVADTSTIRIVRKLPGRAQQVITADAAAVLQGRAQGTLLQPGDVVYVHPTGLADWSRRLTALLGPLGTVVGSVSGVVTAAAVVDSN